MLLSEGWKDVAPGFSPVDGAPKGEEEALASGLDKNGDDEFCAVSFPKGEEEELCFVVLNGEEEDAVV